MTNMMQSSFFDFPAALSNCYDAFRVENVELCDYLEEEMPEACELFDPYGTGNPNTLDEDQFRNCVMEIYQKALPLSL